MAGRARIRNNSGRNEEMHPYKKGIVGMKGSPRPQRFTEGRKSKSTERETLTSHACLTDGKKAGIDTRNQPLTGLDRELADRINKLTLKSAKLIHLGDTLDLSRKIGDAETCPEIEVPSLLQGIPRKSPNGDYVAFRGKKKKLKDIFKDFKSGVMLFTGPAGSGKTTLLKTIARDVLNKKYEGLREVDIVLFLKCADLNCSKRTTESKLLLSNIEPELSEEELKRFENIARTNPEKVLIILDGFDTFPSYFRERLVKQDAQHDSKQKRVSDIVNELLNGKIYPSRCRVITSSREMDFGPFRADVSTLVYLDGLEQKSIYRIGKQFLEPKEAQKLMQMLESHPLLMSLCRTPMFLISTLLGRKENPDFAPSKMSENLLHLIDRFFRSQHCRMGNDDIKRLKKMAFDLLKEGELNFSSKTLSDYGLDPEKVTGLIFTTGGENRVMFFVHQSIHEMFASLHIADLGMRAFKKETSRCNNLPTFLSTFRLLGGIVSNDDIFNKAVESSFITHGTDILEKRDFLKQILKKQIDEYDDKTHPILILHIMLMLHECGDMVNDIIRSSLSRIHLKFPIPYSLSISDLLALASVAVKSKALDDLTLSQCGLNQRHIDILSTMFEAESISIQRLDFSQNDLTDGAMKKTGSIVCSCKVEELSISETAGFRSRNPEHTLFSLKESLQKYKLKTLNISYNDLMLTEKEMTEDNKENEQEFVYGLKTSSEAQCFGQLVVPPHEITWNVHDPGLWKTASYDFLRSVWNLIPNVTEKIILYSWKFSPEWIEILSSNMKDRGGKDLQIILEEKRILENTPFVIAHFNGCGTPSMPLIDEMMKLKIASKNVMAEMPKHETKIAETSETMEKAYTRQKFQILHRDKTSEDVKTFSEMISKNRHMEEVELCECNVNREFLEDLVKQAKNEGENVHVKDLTVAATEDIDDMIPSICQFMKKFKTTGLSLEDSNGTEKLLKILHDNVIKLQIQLDRLDLSYNTNLQDFDEMGRLVSNRVKELTLVNCGLEINSLENFQENVGESKIRYLDISYNTELDDDSISLLPGILCKDEPISLIMHGCELSEDDMDGFVEFKDMQIKKLDLSCNNTLESGGMAQVGRIVSKHQTRELILSSCSLDGECIDSLTEELKDCVMEKLDLSHNSGITPHPQKVVRLLKQSEVQHLDVSSCKITSKQIQHLADEMARNNITLSHINLSDHHRRQLDEEYINGIRKLSEQVKRKFVLLLPGVSDEQKIRLPQNEKMVYGNEEMKI